MITLRSFYPKKQYDSAYVIPYEKYAEKGICGVIFDIDNTLVPHGAPAEQQAMALFKRLKRSGLDTCLVSNNKEPRVAAFGAAVDSKYIFKAGKPSPKSYLKAMELMGTDKGSTLFVGDQLFTDIYGANRAGIHTILVKPIHPKEELQIVLKRFLEKIVLHFYRRDLEKGRLTVRRKQH